jgi:3-isopropylmalate/(R)-2-methylmalate dehydratase small subunit
VSVVARVSGRALPLRGDEIDTDRIIPARFLKAVTFEGLDAHLFEDDRASGPHPMDNPAFAGATVLLVGRNFGCGSSREHAPQALYRRGFRGIIGESFSEIFFGNALALGLPCLTIARQDAHALMDAIEAAPETELTIDMESLTVTGPSGVVSAGLPAPAREAFLTGAWDATGLLRERPEAVRAVAARLSYLADFPNA